MENKRIFNIGFTHDGIEDEVQFDVVEDSADKMNLELINLFADFINENNINKYHIDYIIEEEKPKRIFKVAVNYNCWGLIDVKADTLENAIQYAKDNINELSIAGDVNYTDERTVDVDTTYLYR